MSETASPLSLEQLARVHEVSSFDVSRHGDLVFAWNRPGKWELFAIHAGDGNPRQLTRGAESSLEPEWHPDSRTLLFISDRAGDENFGIFELAEGSPPRAVLQDRWDNHSPQWASDASWIAFASNRGDDNLNLFVMRPDGADIRQLSRGRVPIDHFAWHPDGTRLAFTRAESLHDAKLWLVSVADGSAEKLLDYGECDIAIPERPWVQDGDALLFTSDLHNIFDIGLYDLPTQKVRWLVESRWEKYEPTLSPDGRHLAYVENLDGNLVLMLKDLTSHDPPRRLSPAAGCCFDPRWSADGHQLYFLFTGPRNPPDVWTADIAAGRLTQLTHSLPADLNPARLAAPELVHYPSLDGQQIAAWLYRPSGPRRAAGALVLPHGGPEWQAMNVWSPYVQFMVSHGFTVIEPNYRGSTGYGRRFLKLSDRDLGGGDLRDVVAVRDYLAHMRWAAPDGIGIYGGSYGGYLTMMALTKYPDRWAAGVSIVGFFNWKTEYETEREYLKHYDSQKVGTPETNPAFFYERSPINFVDAIQAPVLIIHGEQDPRCPVGEARQIIERLAAKGKPHALRIYPDEGHGFRKIENRIDAYKHALEFFQQHLATDGKLSRETSG